MSDPARRIGVDLGGTKIEGVVLDGAGSQVVRRRVETPREWQGTLDAIADLVAGLAADSETGADVPVGVGIPGTPSPEDGRIRNANSTWLNGRPLRAALEARLERPVRLENDANCFALSEATDGAGAGAQSVFGVILGTGVGGGIVIGGALYPGATRIAGEWGHLPLPAAEPGEWPGPACWCGRSGCVEAWLSGPGMAADHRRENAESAAAGPMDAAAIAAAAERGDAAARATLDRWTTRLGRALALVVNVLDPEVVVLGGGVSNIRGLAERLGVELRPHLFTDVVRTRIVRHRHGDSSGVLGAARLWDRVSSP